MIKQIKRYGNSLVIIIDKEEQEWFGLDESDWVKINELTKLEKKKDDNKI